MTRPTKRGMAGRIWPADCQFDTPGVCDCAVHLKNSVQYASIMQKIYSMSHGKCNSDKLQLHKNKKS